MLFIDSSVWVAHLFESSMEASSIVESENLLFTSLLSIFEIRKKLVKANCDIEMINNSINYIKEKSIIVTLEEDIINSAVNFSIKYNLGALDALIYASTIIIKAQLITADNDFRNLENVKIIKK
ncbi:MAG: PIN domain-containing protein [Nanoarchaeota archaeon]